MKKYQLEMFRGLSVLVIGDLMLDKFIQGRVERMSPESGVPVLSWDSELIAPGGAANVAVNIKQLKGTPLLHGIVGNDFSGKQLMQELNEGCQINTDRILHSPWRITTEKCRFFDKTSPLIRYDRETIIHLEDEEMKHFMKLLSKKRPLSPKPVAAILQDYNKGVLHENSIDSLIKWLDKQGILVAVDPKIQAFFSYKNVYLFKPNLKEVSIALKKEVQPVLKELNSAANIIFERMQCKNLLITLGEKGIYYNDGQHSGIVPSIKINMVDVSGAGDTVISAALMALLSDFTLAEAAHIANVAGGIACTKPFVQPVDLDELQYYLDNGKLLR